MSRPAEKVPILVLKGRNVEEVRNTTNHVTQSMASMPSGDSVQQLQHQHSAVQLPSSTGSVSSFTGRMC